MPLQNEDSSSNDPIRSMHKAKPTPLWSILISAFLAVFFISIGIIFLVSPIPARKMLYPCLSAVEHGDESPNNSRLVVESDAIRLAGACLLSIGVSSLMLLIPLLRCCHFGEKQDAGDREYLGDFFFLRTMFFLQATMGLSLLGAGLINLEKAENGNSYGGGQSNNNNQHFHCSSLKDQSILWVGVGIVCLTSIGMMFSFWPESHPTELLTETINNPQRKGHTYRCCKKNKRRVHSIQLESSMTESLLQSHDQSLDSLHVNNDTSETIELDVNEADMCNEHTEDERTATEVTAVNPSQEQSSRLRGTRRLLKLAGRQSLFLWVGIGVLLIRLPFSLAIPHYVSSTIGDLINEDYDGAKRSVLLLFLLGTVDSVLDFWCIFLFGYAKENIVKGVRIDTFASILSQEQAFFDKTNTGDLNSRLTADCGEMAGDLTWFFRFSVEAAVRIVGIATYMLIRSPFLGLCTILIVPAVGVINKVYGDWLSKNASSVQNSLAEASTVAHESLACIKTVITSASENYESEKYATKIDDLYALNIRQIIAQGIYFMVVSTFLINTCVQSALLLIGSVLVDEGRLTPEILLSFMLYQGQLQEYTLNLFQSYSSLIKSSGAGDRVFFLLDREPPPPGTGNPSVKSLMTPSTTATTSENIAIRSVTFSYPTRPDTLVLRKFCLEIKQGSLVALVGMSGGGKSTVISLLERLYDPNEGTIEFGNVDLKQMNLKAHREKIGLVTQDPVLFSGTIRENIGYGSSATLEEVVEAAKVANAHNFIESFPNKYDELVGERGMNLSGGQKQRIAIARAIVKKPGLLLLDEATSALDSESEAAVQAALNDLLGNRAGMTTVVIAHRLQTVRNADTIAVLKNGEVVEQGTHEELLQISSGNYRRMIDRADSMGILPE